MVWTAALFLFQRKLRFPLKQKHSETPKVCWAQNPIVRGFAAEVTALSARVSLARLFFCISSGKTAFRQLLVRIRGTNGTIKSPKGKTKRFQNREITESKTFMESPAEGAERKAKMAVRYRVNPQELVKQAQELQSLNERFKAEVSTMTEKEQALSSMWEGEARNAFHNAYAADVEKFQNFYNGIVRFIEALSNAAQEYVKAEQAAASIGNQRA